MNVSDQNAADILNITEESAAATIGATMREACAATWCAKAMADVFDHPKAVAMGAEELADWLRTEDR